MLRGAGVSWNALQKAFDQAKQTFDESARGL
jgi:hypothetical protein